MHFIKILHVNLSLSLYFECNLYVEYLSWNLNSAFSSYLLLSLVSVEKYINYNLLQTFPVSTQIGFPVIRCMIAVCAFCWYSYVYLNWLYENKSYRIITACKFLLVDASLRLSGGWISKRDIDWKQHMRVYLWFFHEFLIWLQLSGVKQQVDLFHKIPENVIPSLNLCYGPYT